MRRAFWAYKMYPESENRFFLLETGYDIIFEEKSGVTELTVVIQPGFERTFKKF